MPTPRIIVVKSDGTEEVFRAEKLEHSLHAVGAPPEVVRQVVAHMEGELVNGMSTADIYRHAFALLRAQAHKAAARYSLRRSITALGPTGFPFEKFVAELLRRQGFSVSVDQTVKGACVEHEIDLVAWNGEKLFMVEAKYHHELAYKTDVKVALYVKARFDDLKAGTYRYGSHTMLSEGWIITNTKFTERAIAYGECAGVRLLGWNYPRRENLHDLISETGVTPVTCLTTFSDREKQLLLEQGIVLCQSVRKDAGLLRSLGFSEALIKSAQEESNLLCPP